MVCSHIILDIIISLHYVQLLYQIIHNKKRDVKSLVTSPTINYNINNAKKHYPSILKLNVRTNN